MLPPIPARWRSELENATTAPSFAALQQFLQSEVECGAKILPESRNIFRALELTPLDSVRVVILGQDPYPTPGHAHGLCFSVAPEVRPLPRSLQNIYKELRSDVGFQPPSHGHLEAWARQGVLLLNAVLTVRAGEANAHKDHGWEPFTTAVLEQVNRRQQRVVFLLWGRDAQRKREFITATQHAVIETAHPSPLSARKFFGCRCFSRTNTLLRETGLPPIDWQLPLEPEPGLLPGL